MRTLSHDPFSRTSTVKSEGIRNGRCAFCGQDKTIYQYGTQADDSNRINWHLRMFCSKDCHDSYHHW